MRVGLTANDPALQGINGKLEAPWYPKEPTFLVENEKEGSMLNTALEAEKVASP